TPTISSWWTWPGRRTSSTTGRSTGRWPPAAWASEQPAGGWSSLPRAILRTKKNGIGERTREDVGAPWARATPFPPLLPPQGRLAPPAERVLLVSRRGPRPALY